MRTVSLLDRADAELAILTVRDALLAEGRAAVVAVADAHGDLLALLRLDGAPVASVAIATNKAWTAAREGIPTRAIGRRIRSAEDGYDIAYHGDPKYVGWGGGLPVRDRWGVVSGAVAVSGLPEDEDERFAALGVAAIEGRG
jgi:glc operon protein GlcG